MDYLYLPVILGTVRKGRKSEKVARYIVELGKQLEGVKTELVDPRDFNLPGDGNDEEAKDPKYSEITARADGFIIVVPEYNHSFSGSLKRLLDSELKNYIHKPAAFVGVSSGPFGGTRAIESLVSPVRELGLIATFSDTNIPKIAEAFGDDGKPNYDWLEQSAKGTWYELIWMAETLKWGRENLESKFK